MSATTNPLTKLCELALSPHAPEATALACDDWFRNAECIGTDLIRSTADQFGIQDVDALVELIGCLMVHAWGLDDAASARGKRYPQGAFRYAVALATNRVATVAWAANSDPVPAGEVPK